jgi:DNA-binding response OmpR family regulator
MKIISNRILVLDDDPDIGIMIKLMLEYHGYAVLVTQRAEKATLLIANEDFDLLIMDMLLSGVNGIDICTRLKKDNTTAQLPVIMISAHPNAKEICMNAGANDFIAKPFDMDELLSKIAHFVPLHGKI